MKTRRNRGKPRLSARLQPLGRTLSDASLRIARPPLVAAIPFGIATAPSGPTGLSGRLAQRTPREPCLGNEVVTLLPREQRAVLSMQPEMHLGSGATLAALDSKMHRQVAKGQCTSGRS